MADTEQNWDFTGLRAMFLNGTLKRSPEVSNTEGLIEVSASIMRRHGVEVEVLREHGWETDEWPQIWERVKAANILVIAGPIWLGDNSSKTKQIIERLYAQSGQLNDQGQYAFYGRVGGALITGNEDGVKHCTMNILYSLQHLGYVVPPQADAGWIGDIGPGPSYLDEGSGGPDNDFTNRNTTFMTWNLMHLAAMIQRAGGIPAYGNQRSAWDEGERFDFVPGAASHPVARRG